MTAQAAELPMIDAYRKPTSAISEGEIVHGYSGIGARAARRALAEIRDCACGEAIVAISIADADVVLAVSSHNLTTAHQQWRAARERA